MTPASSILTFACVASLAIATPAAHSQPGSGPRFWVAAGPSFMGSDDVGYALNGGVEFGRAVALTLEAGYEHYPSEFDTYLTNNLAGGPPVLRVEDEGGPGVFSGTIGVRAAMASGSFEPFVDAAIGAGAVRDPGYRLVDPATGAVFQPARSDASQAVIADVGLGARTRRESGFDVLLAFRARLNWEFEGVALPLYQVRVGIMSP